MSAIVKEIYDAFISAGVSDQQATAAARTIPSIDDIAKSADMNALRADMVVLRADMDALRVELKGEMKALELRVTIKLYAMAGAVVAATKALDFLIG